jgi:hypothetical protein
MKQTLGFNLEEANQKCLNYWGNMLKRFFVAVCVIVCSGVAGAQSTTFDVTVPQVLDLKVNAAAVSFNFSQTATGTVNGGLTRANLDNYKTFLNGSSDAVFGPSAISDSTSAAVTVPTANVTSNTSWILKVKTTGAFVGNLDTPLDAARVKIAAQPLSTPTNPLVGAYKSAAADVVLASGSGTKALQMFFGLEMKITDVFTFTAATPYHSSVTVNYDLVSP